MVDLGEEWVRPIERPPSFEDRVRYLENPIIDLRVIRGQSRSQVLRLISTRVHLMREGFYINESVPLLPEVTVGNHAYCVTELILDI